ncbi:OsmC family protein [Pseudonocardia acaciae]|uniref:OsmC family protein n=1 Tax=Pseudonocardia acaciae TaxID=551276 RepID=UPI00048A6AD0|nr:OsmC family protein [Pseudonocardia acaciae]
MVEASALPTPYQVRFRAGPNSGTADTLKNGVGGHAGPRPHELLEAALASCMTITARMALERMGVSGVEVNVEVELERTEEASTFRYRLTLDPPQDDARYDEVVASIERSPVRRTLSKPLLFEPATRR